MIAERLSAALADRYRIERELGSGGMATVYLAEDLKHDRKVAIKVLKPELAAVLGGERFVVEIKTTAAMSHPHILPLFDSGTADGFLFYVMPYIQGETIREKLNREMQFAVDDAVRIAREVADALDYAHRHGVIHRDIKPENILLHDGRAMVMDFGIALAVSAAAGGRMTETGLSLGTPHYMSPEQATADRDITGRSDIYSLASVLYEMLTGEPPHMGTSAQQIIMKIIAEPVRPATDLRKSVPPHVSDAVAKALEKLPADRFANAKEFALALGDTSYRGAVDAGAAAASPRGADWRIRAAIPALVAAGALGLAAAVLAVNRPAARPVARYEIAWPATDRGTYASVDVSPDGSMLAFASGPGGLFIRRRDRLEPIPVRDAEGASNPSFSPNGRELAFQVGSTIRAIGTDGTSPPRTVTDSLVGQPGLDWGSDGFIYYDHRGIGPLLRVRATGGAPEVVGALDTTSSEMQHNYPDVLPNGRGVIFTINRGGPGRQATPNDGIGVLDLRTGRHHELMRGVFAKYAPSGHLLYVTVERELLAVGFDADRLELIGAPISLATGIALRSNGSADLRVAEDGTLYYSVGSDVPSLNRLVWIARNGSRTSFNGAVGTGVGLAEISPDGQRIAYVEGAQGRSEAWVVPITGGRPDRITFEATVTSLAWSHDSRDLFLTSTREVVQRVEARAGAVLARLPGSSVRNITTPQASPDGKSLVFSMLFGGNNRDMMILSLGPDTTLRTLIATAQDERGGMISPDGRWIAYQSGGGSDGALLAKPFPDVSGSPRQLTSARGGLIRWSRDGRQLFYLSALDSMKVLSFAPGRDLVVTDERTLFDASDLVSYSPAPDGRILAVQSDQVTAARRLIVVENVFEELRRRVPR